MTWGDAFDTFWLLMLFVAAFTVPPAVHALLQALS